MIVALLGKTMEIYVDDMVVKNIGECDHIWDLDECFWILRKYKMRLNLIKYAFGVSLGQLLGHVVSKRGIKTNLI